MENLGVVNPDHKGHQELFKIGSRYVVVSTVRVEDSAAESPVNAALIGLGSIRGYATSGEETMAFPADSDGNVTSWCEVAVANGDNSRQIVLDELKEDE